MPELPEVETICRDLRPHIEGRVLTDIMILDPRWCMSIAPNELADALRQRQVESVTRRGKYIVWEFSESVFLHMHLRMTGTLLLRRAVDEGQNPLPAHTRVRFQFDDNGMEVLFVDPRRFGTGELAIGHTAHDDFFAKRVGIEPFSDEFTPKNLYALTSKSRAPIKAFLLNQKRIAGVGNIYADEALFRARIHPLCPADRVTLKQCTKLHDAILVVLEAGIAARGASIDDYRDPDGVKGRFQDQFLVHRRQGEPCPSCGRPIRKIVVAGRGTYVCDHCQRPPKIRVLQG